MDRVKIAIQKNGRLSSDSLSLLKKCGIEFNESKNMLFIKSTNMPVDLLMVRDDDIPRLVGQKIADLGIVGENVIKEKQLSNKALQIDQKIKLNEPNRRGLNLMLDLQNRQITTLLLLEACLFREESRGGHYREDFPEKNETWKIEHDLKT